ncbi:MAG: hypothetical protein PCFJNLEI_03659 [Verrucomicrobiae bacterium]|nr:hypothetical protein [Verrucomicrobiae bacterium]
MITHLIVNSPYDEPKYHWLYHRETRSFSLESGRRPAGYVIATEASKSFDDPGHFIPIELVNLIRPRVQAWRVGGYAGVTGVTKRLLEHWNDPEQRESRRFFFCQLEAMETLIWLAEAPTSERVGIEVPSAGGQFSRWCCKMATGSGKTIVMAMLAAWQILNKVASPQDARFAKHIFIVAPGLTVRKRLQVLIPSDPGNYYDEFHIVPTGMRDMLLQGRVVVRNWHVLNWDTEEKLKKRRSVDKRGAKSDEAYAREVLGELAMQHNILVINDEAHHAWRVPAVWKGAKVDRQLIDEATKWVGGLDRIHAARGILRCFDFSATPFAPSGKTSTDEALFDWIVSDFGLNDAIESGLVKTPRVVVRDDAVPDAKTYKSKLYHIYDNAEVRSDLTRKAEEYEPLPSLVSNAYLLLGKDWLLTKQEWEKRGSQTPPVIISVANRTETAARIKYSFDKKKVMIEELCDPERTLHIDSKVLDLAEERDEEQLPQTEAESEADDDAPKKKLTKVELAEKLRRQVDTVGKPGTPGEQIQNVISVGMLSEGWDAKTVTHIMGLRAFSSQLLCEQVVGRGLRRTSYDVIKTKHPITGEDAELFEPEYVNIFGVPFTFLPHEGGEDEPPPPPKPKTRIEPVKTKEEAFAINWPNVIRIDHVYRPKLELEKPRPLVLNATDKIQNTELAAIVAGKPNLAVMTEIDLQALAERFRLQKIIFEVARDVYEQVRPTWNGDKSNLLAQVIQLVEKFIRSPKLEINPPLFYQDEMRRRVMLALNMSRIVQHVFDQIRFANTEGLTPVFDSFKPIRGTADMLPWYTGKPCESTKRSHINFVVVDSAWEAQAAYELDHNKAVTAWAKNDHLWFEVSYIFGGAFSKYRPDYLIRLSDGTNLVIEIKGVDDEKNRTKRRFLDEWVNAVNQHGGFGVWKWDVCFSMSDLPSVIHKATRPVEK